MRDRALDNILNPPHEELHVANCSWHHDWNVCDCGALDDMCARSSVEEQGPSKPKVAGSTPAGRDLAVHELLLAQEVTQELLRHCSSQVYLNIHNAFARALQTYGVSGDAYKREPSKNLSM